MRQQIPTFRKTGKSPGVPYATKKAITEQEDFKEIPKFKASAKTGIGSHPGFDDSRARVKTGGHSTIEKEGFCPCQLTKTKAKMADPELQRIHKSFGRKS